MVGVAVLAAVGARAGSEPARAGTSAVGVTDFQFSPASVDVQLGTKVLWLNQGAATHSVTSDTGAFDVTLDPSGTAEVQFTQAGTYAYHCKYHAQMIGAPFMAALGWVIHPWGLQRQSSGAHRK
jgi:plastocyanin